MPPLTGTLHITTSCWKNLRPALSLTGTEVKAIRSGKANLKDSYGLVKDGELWLLNCHISPYEHGSYSNHSALRTRKLLVHRDELKKLIGQTQQKGLTLIPTRMYFKNGRVKIELRSLAESSCGISEKPSAAELQTARLARRWFAATRVR